MAKHQLRLRAANLGCGARQHIAVERTVS